MIYEVEEVYYDTYLGVPITQQGIYFNAYPYNSEYGENQRYSGNLQYVKQRIREVMATSYYDVIVEICNQFDITDVDRHDADQIIDKIYQKFQYGEQTI